MANKITLTRLEIERIVTYLALNRNVEQVDIEQTSYGIGFGHVVHYFYPSGESISQDITDVSNW